MATTTQHNPNVALNARLNQAGGSKTIYALVTPETEATKAAMLGNATKAGSDSARAAHLEQFRDAITRLPTFDAKHVEQALSDVAEAAGGKKGDLIHPARVAATGKSVGMGLFEYMEILGQPSSLARLQRAILEVSRRVAVHKS